MTLGEKIRQVRQQRGMSQSQVAGSYMTRNMLSQLENDLASPSVKTLLYLADILEVSPGWLLDSDASFDRMTVKAKLKELFRNGDYWGCLKCFGDRETVPDDEESLILFRCALVCAGQALQEGKLSDADSILCFAEKCKGLYIGKNENASLSVLRLEWKLACGQTDDRLMDAVREQTNADVMLRLAAEHDLLHGRHALESGKFGDALTYLHRAEASGVLDASKRRNMFALLEYCYKEQEDYKQAYRYATLRMDE